MSKRISFKLRGDDAKAAIDFANAVGHSLDRIAEVALVKYINDTLTKAEALAQKEKQETSTTSI
jgi:hypothetical protein